MIWAPTNDGDQTLLFSQTGAFAASATPSWISTTGNIDFTLNAGSTYYFAFIGDNLIDVGFIFPLPTSPPSSNGLTAVETGSTNYNFFDTTFAGGRASRSASACRSAFSPRRSRRYGSWWGSALRVLASPAGARSERQRRSPRRPSQEKRATGSRSRSLVQPFLASCRRVSAKTG
jgi:hypothetical protein